jgi:hypothetical protein
MEDRRSMKTWKFVLPVFVFVAGLVVTNTASFAKPEYSKKEGKACTTCHVKTGSKELNKVGDCYKTKKSLADCAATKQ